MSAVILRMVRGLIFAIIASDSVSYLATVGTPVLQSGPQHQGSCWKGEEAPRRPTEDEMNQEVKSSGRRHRKKRKKIFRTGRGKLGTARTIQIEIPTRRSVLADWSALPGGSKARRCPHGMPRSRFARSVLPPGRGFPRQACCQRRFGGRASSSANPSARSPRTRAPLPTTPRAGCQAR